jgi:glyoxalase-like protein
MQAHAEDLHPGLDHLVINARDQLDDAAAAYRRLGFYLTPRGFHTLGSMNHLAVFADNYLELVGVPPENPRARPELAHASPGLNGYVFRTHDPEALYRRLLRRRVTADPPGEFSRPVDVDGERHDARFQTLRLGANEFPVGRVYFCHHLTPELVWRREWQTHPNGAVEILAAVWVVQDPKYYVRALARIAGQQILRSDAQPASFAVGGTTIELYDYSRFGERYGTLAIDAGERADFMACVRVRTTSLDVARRWLAGNRVAFDAGQSGSIVVPSAEAFNVVVEFCE